MSDMESMIFHFKQVMEGVKPSRRRGLLRCRESQGRTGLLPGLGRDRQAGALADPAAVVPQPGRPAQAVRRGAAVRRDCDQRERGHRDGRDRPVSTHTDRGVTTRSSSARRWRRLEALYPKYPNKMALLLPALWLVQEARGWISEGASREVAERLEPDPGLRPWRRDVLHHVPHASGGPALHPGLHHLALQHLRRGRLL